MKRIDIKQYLDDRCVVAGIPDGFEKPCKLWTLRCTKGVPSMYLAGYPSSARRTAWTAAHPKAKPLRPTQVVSLCCGHSACLEPTHMVVMLRHHSTLGCARPNTNPGARRLKISDAIDILTSSMTGVEAATKYGISREAVRLIRSGQTYQDAHRLLASNPFHAAALRAAPSP